MSIIQLFSAKPPGPPPVPPLNPGFWLSPSGHDSNTGTKLDPFLTPTKADAAMVASPTKKTAYFMPGTHSIGALPTSAGNTWMGDPADPPYSAILNATASNLSGANSVADITLKNLKFTSALNNGAGILLFVGCPRLKILGCQAVTTQWQGFMTVYGLRAGSRLQGLRYNCPTMGPTNTQGLFPLNFVHNDGFDVDDVILSDVDGVGGTFGVQWQDQAVDGSGVALGIWTNVHCDRLNLTGWGSDIPGNTVGNEGISFVGSNNPANHSNTMDGCNLIQGSSVGSGVEVGTAGCTYSNNTIVATYGLGGGNPTTPNCPNSLFDGNNLTVTGASIGGNGTDVEVRTNIVNGSSYTGAGSTPLCFFTPAATATGKPINTPSAPYP